MAEESNLLKQIYAQQRLLIEKLDEPRLAQIATDRAERPNNVRRIELDLSKARDVLDPQRLGYSFKSIYVEHCDDPSAKIFVRPTTIDEHQSYFSLGYKDSWNVDRGILDAFFHWPKQNGKMILIVFTDSEFKSGSQVSLTSGGVSISEGSHLIQLLPKVLVANVVEEILPQNLYRKLGTVINKTGSIMWLGGPSVSNFGNDEGIELAPGDSVKWRNTGALYAFSATGGKIIRQEQQ